MKSIVIKQISILCIFSILYTILPSNSFNKEMESMDSIYFAITTHTTAGFGDIYPITRRAKLLVIFHLLLVFFTILNN
jgi:hypothetical protein